MKNRAESSNQASNSWPLLSLCLRCYICTSQLGSRERIEQLGPIRRADSSACVPSWPGAIGSVITTGHIPQGVGLDEPLVILIERGIQVAIRMPSLLIHDRDQARPERCNGAGSTKHVSLLVFVDPVTRLGIGISSDIRHPSTDTMA